MIHFWTALRFTKILIMLKSGVMSELLTVQCSLYENTNYYNYLLITRLSIQPWYCWWHNWFCTKWHNYNYSSHYFHHIFGISGNGICFEFVKNNCCKITVITLVCLCYSCVNIFPSIHSPFIVFIYLITLSSIVVFGDCYYRSFCYTIIGVTLVYIHAPIHNIAVKL